MEFKFYNPDGKLVKRDINVDQKWSEVKTSNNYINSIFKQIDDGDGIIQEREISLLKQILNKADKLIHKTSNNNILENEELSKLFDSTIIEDYKLSYELYDDICAKNFLGLPTTRETISENILKINPQNVLQVLEGYKDKTNEKESLFGGILGEVGLPLEERFKYVRHIVGQIVLKAQHCGVYIDDIRIELERELEYQKDKWLPASAERIDAIANKLIDRIYGKNYWDQSKNILPNGKIDGDFKQGNTGDCWLLASIKAISISPKGRKILEDSIKIAPNGDVTVTLKGVNKSYTFTRKEIEGNMQFSTGDLDVRALEMAVDKYFAEERGVNDSIDLNDNWGFVAFNILTGKGDFDHFFSFGSIGDYRINPDYYNHEFTDEDIKNFNKSNHIATVSANGNVPQQTCSTTNGSSVTLITNHAYSVSHSDNIYVYLINPHDTSTEIKVPHDTFKKFFNFLQEVDL